MNGLKDTFEGQVDFFDLDIDDASLNKLRQTHKINGRSQYVLLAPDGEVLRIWYGPLNLTSMEAQFASIIEENGY